MTDKQIEYRNLLEHYREKRQWIKVAYNEYKSSSNIDGLPKGKGYKVSYRMEELIDSVKNLEEKLDTILLLINKLSPIHQDILQKRFIQGMSHKDISEEKDVDLDRVYHLISNAKKEFTDLVKSGEKTK